MSFINVFVKYMSTQLLYVTPNCIPLMGPCMGLKGKGVTFSNPESGVNGTCLNLHGRMVRA